MFSNPSSGPPFVWPGTNWDWLSQPLWLGPNGTYWTCGSYLWTWLLPGWTGRCTLGLAFTHGFIFSELPEKPANSPHLKTQWARSVFHWYDYLAAVFVPSLGTTDVMLRVDALTNFTQQALQDSQKVISALMLDKHKLKRWFYKTDWIYIFWQLCKEKLVPLFIPNAVHIYLIWALMLLILLNTWTRWLGLWILLKPQLPHFGRH